MDINMLSVLVGKDDEDAFNLGELLKRDGATVIYTNSSPLRIQHEALLKKPHALIISSVTNSSDELCALLKTKEYSPYIVFLHDGYNNKNKHYNHADLIIDRNDDSNYEKLCKHILNKSRFVCSQIKNNDLNQLIADILFELCITKNYNGYQFIFEAIKLAADMSPISRCISKDVYPQIAKNFGVSSCCVERNIRTAIRSSWAKCSSSVKRKYFGPFTRETDWMPTNSQFIFIISDRITANND